MKHAKEKLSTGTIGGSSSALTIFLFVMGLVPMLFAPSAKAAIACDQEITANVAVLDSPTVFNRLGAQNPNWITYALLRDVVEAVPDANGILQPGPVCTAAGNCSAGNVMLRPDKRPRPLVVRSVAGSCLTVNFTNLLDPVVPGQAPNGPQQLNPDLPNGGLFNDDFVADRCASFHAQGVELVNSMADDGSQVGVNPGTDQIAAGQCGSGIVAPGENITYQLYTPHEGTFTVNSYGATIGGEQNSGNLGIGMFAQLNVQPVGASIYRSQMTEEELRLATVEADIAGSCALGAEASDDGFGVTRCYTPGGQPVIDYEALYPNVEPWISEGKAGLPVVNMLTAANELVHSDINAIITGPNADGTFPGSTYPLESVGNNVPSLPNRLEPFREFSSIFHDEQTNSQVFPNWYGDPVLGYTLAGVKDQFMINTGSGGIGSEIISNRLHTGPMHDCAGCAYEEFFLASQTVGDPAGLVNMPANTGIEACSPRDLSAGPGQANACWRNEGLSNGPMPGNYALYQEDPSNVHHSYTGDATKIRNIHAGAFEQHIFHLHNHQWLFNPNDDNANYLDAQEIMPGSGHTYELANGGSGNRNKTAGDAIFHCHFYPHFAQGMWYHIRIQDMFETGTVLAISRPVVEGGDDANGDGFHDTTWALRSGKPAAGARALPDAELPDGWPIPAILPLPGKGMPLMPAPVQVVAVDRGAWSLLGGRTGPDGIPESSQAVIDYAVVAGADKTLGTADDVSPGFPFWLAGNECGVSIDQVGLNAAGIATNCPMGTVGHRQPTPPLDMLTEAGAAAAGFNPAQAGGWDGGLPRHNLLGYTSGSFTLDTNNRLDFAKEIEVAQPVYFPETGTEMEKVSMAYHAVRERDTWANNLSGTPSSDVKWVANGAPPVPGGPFQDPCIDDRGTLLNAGVVGDWFDGTSGGLTNNLTTKGGSAFSSDNPRTYKVANVQLDAVFNKVGYHYSQERIIALWEDVAPLIAKERPPEPLVMRFNTFDCGKILHANLVPKEFEVDDFQVRTPTDIIGQHIHLPKWDLTTNDGAANGWNYEDGALSPGMVQERITAINHFNDLAAMPFDATAATGADGVFNGRLVDAAIEVGFAGKVPQQLVDLLGPNGTNAQHSMTDLAAVATIDTGDIGGTQAGLTHLEPKAHPFFAEGTLGQDHLGARTVIQRLLMDPLVNVAGVDRGLGLTFSHDHYGPSTFQQIGLYSTILAEPAGSTWVHNESGVELNTRHDGGPTTWQAAILTPAAAPGGSTVGSENISDHREFYFEMSDFQHGYEKGVFIGADEFGVPKHTTIVQPNVFNVVQAEVAAGEPLANSWRLAVNPPLKVPAVGAADASVDAGGPNVVKAEPNCPGDGVPVLDPNTGLTTAPTALRPCVEAINISHSSMWVTNYRNEPVALRVFDPNKLGPDGKRGAQADGDAGDLALALSSKVSRQIPQLNTSFGDMPAGYRTPATYCQGNDGDGINCDRNAGDPITPIMRAYERDEVKVKIQVGATEEQHQATIHGLRWLSNGSGFGSSKNSGWRNFQSTGISEQFSLQVPVNPDPNQLGQTVDYLYNTDATRDGFWSGTWGLLRSYGQTRQDLVELPSNPQQGPVQVVNANEFAGVCPRVGGNGRGSQAIANLREYNVTAVLANDILPNNLGVIIPDNANPTGNVGGALDPNGGTLVYNRRQTMVPDVTIAGEGGEPALTFEGGQGPLNDPTAIMYVRTADMADPNNPKAGLKAGVPVEPLVLRANAGDCIEVTLRNRLPADTQIMGPGPDGLMGTADDVVLSITPSMPDLEGWQDMMWVVNRELFEPQNARGNEMTYFNNNLVRPSNRAGLHAQLVEYDASRDDGLRIGGNAQGDVSPGADKTYRWYAGDLAHEVVTGGNPNQRRFRIVATPIEFGGTNILSADRVKQPQKGMFGALVIEPEGATWDETTQVADGQGTGAATRLTRAQADISSPAGYAGSGGDYREALAIGHKITNLRWSDGKAIKNVNQEELGREGAEDSGHAGFNYGMEPPWFRFQVPPNVPFGNAGTPGTYGAIENAHAMYSNPLVANATHPNFIPAIPGVSEAGDPQTPVFRAPAGAPARMHVLNGASADRDGTWMLHGHLWQRDPFVCPEASQDDQVGLVGRCDPDAVASQALGLNPQGKWMATEEGMGHAYGHWPILLESAGGGNAIAGDYLYRDYAPNGNRNGQFGILRVE